MLQNLQRKNIRLWELNSLGIKDPNKKSSKLDLQDLALKHFKNTILRDDEGRCIISIPWIEGSETLEDHYSKGRLGEAVKTLKFTGRLFDFEHVFVDWEKKGIIEKIAQDEPNKCGKFHYLPHRPVFKENSTTEIRPVIDALAHHDANAGSHLPINIDPELSKHQAAATPSTQPCSSVSKGGAQSRDKWTPAGRNLFDAALSQCS
ncbi:DUF1758 domain-containing protein [Trichonephila clavata]|uniref:DUF1758 domain-containing protein n=1 Tax=Trichonephila clavata TaxID=2740835 RepID=A0A8X6FRK5_TRICU|nr:DUF1758 domain-containing protein [Trichonephila clavata]